MSAVMRWFTPVPAARALVGALLIVPLFQVPLFAQTADQAEVPADAEPEQAPAETELPEEAPVFMTSAILQGLDKITARVSEFDAPLGETVKFGSFEIVARVCEKTPPEEPPESTAFLEITDIRPDEPARVVFRGWMFASSPALSAVEHPVYDVWVTGCRISQLEPALEEDSPAESGESQEPAAQ